MSEKRRCGCEVRGGGGARERGGLGDCIGGCGQRLNSKYRADPILADGRVDLQKVQQADLSALLREAPYDWRDGSYPQQVGRNQTYDYPFPHDSVVRRLLDRRVCEPYRVSFVRCQFVRCQFGSVKSLSNGVCIQTVTEQLQSSRAGDPQ